VTAFAADNSYVFWQSVEVLPLKLSIEPEVGFVDMRGVGLGTPLAQLYTEAVTQGRRDDVRELLGAIVPGLRNLEILVSHRMEPVLHLVFADKSVPVALAGDGVRTMLRLSLELASRGRGLVLVEEPEVHQHPKALQQSARALLAAVRRGLQIVLATHSLELIDALLLEATQDDLPRLSTYRLKLDDGVLASSRLDGEQMAFARGQIEEDLR
jgi:AAA ATPase domain